MFSSANAELHAASLLGGLQPPMPTMRRRTTESEHPCDVITNLNVIVSDCRTYILCRLPWILRMCGDASMPDPPVPCRRPVQSVGLAGPARRDRQPRWRWRVPVRSQDRVWQRHRWCGTGSPPGSCPGHTRPGHSSSSSTTSTPPSATRLPGPANPRAPTRPSRPCPRPTPAHRPSHRAQPARTSAAAHRSRFLTPPACRHPG